MADLPAPGSAYALLIGAADFSDSAHYAPLPSAHKSVGKLAELLQAEHSEHAMWQLPDDRIEVLGPAVTADEARKALQVAVTEKNPAALLVCISCHGHRYPEDGHNPPGLHLAMSNSFRDLPGSHWHFDEVRNALAVAAEKIKHILLIVDACWADGTAVNPGQGSGDSAQLDRLARPGLVVLSATKYRVVAWPDFPGTDWTAFLGALILSIESGEAGPKQILTAADVFSLADSRLAAARGQNRQMPEPEIYRAGLSDVPLCRNQAYLPPVAPTAGRHGQAPDFRDGQACFAAVDARHRDGRDEQIQGIVQHFCASLSVAEEEVADLVGRLRQSTLSSYLEYAYQAACAGRDVPGIVALVHCLHGKGLPVGGEILAAMRERRHSGRDVAGLYQAMRDFDCTRCQEVAEMLSTQLVLGDPELAAASLAVWQ